jgi:hypothetical protein
MPTWVVRGRVRSGRTVDVDELSLNIYSAELEESTALVGNREEVTAEWPTLHEKLH